MEPFFWPLTGPSASYLMKATPKGGAALPEPYKPKYHKFFPQAKPVSGQLTKAQANAILDKYFAGLEERLMTEIYNSLNNNKMNNSNTKKQQTHQEFMLEKVNGLITKTNRALANMRGPLKASTFTTADAQLLDFGEEVNEFSEVQKGSKATVDGKPAEGEYLMPDGTKLTFERGVVTEIVTPVKNRLPFKAKRKPSGLRRPFHKN